MKNAKSIVWAAVVITALSTTTLAKAGTISTTTRTGTISTTKTGTISTTRTGTISTTRTGTISTTRTGLDRFSFVELLLTTLGIRY